MIKIKNFNAVKQNDFDLYLSERFEQYNNFWISCMLNVHLTCNRSLSGHPQGIGDDGQTHMRTNRHRFAKTLLIKPTHTFANQWMLSSRTSSQAAAGVKGWSAANLFIQSNFLCRWQADMISVRESHRRQRTRVFTRAGPHSYLISARLLSASDAVLLRRQGDGVRGLYVIWTSDLRGETFYFRKGKSRQEYQSVFKWFNSSSVQLSSGGGPSRMNRQWERPTILPESRQRKSLHHSAHTVYPVSLLSTPPPHPSVLSPNPPSTQPQPSLQNGLAPGGFQNGELLLPAQPVSIPGANGASINGRGQPRCLHPLPAASPVRRASFCGQGRSPPLQQCFLHVRLHVPPAGRRTTRLPKQGLPSFPSTPPSSVCPTKYGLLPHKHAQPQRRWGLPALRFSSGGPWWSGRWIPVRLHPSQEAKGLPGGRGLSAPALLGCRRERVWLWRFSDPLQFA